MAIHHLSENNFKTNSGMNCCTCNFRPGGNLPKLSSDLGHVAHPGTPEDSVCHVGQFVRRTNTWKYFMDDAVKKF